MKKKKKQEMTIKKKLPKKTDLFFFHRLFFLQKPKMSVGQRKLAKASTAGMKPLSSFFAKKA